MLDLLDPNKRGENLTNEQRETAMELMYGKILKNPVFAGHESQAIAEVDQFRSCRGVFAERSWVWEVMGTGNLDSLIFWRGYFHDTILCTVFKALYMSPVTSAAPERNWAIRGAIHTKNR